MSQTVYAANKIMDQLFGGTTFSVPANYYMGLSTTPITSSGTGATEPTGGGYERAMISNTKSKFSVSTSGSIANIDQISFPESTEAWGTISHVFLSDDPSAGHIWFYEALSTPKVVQAYTTVQFNTGALTLSQTNT